MTVDLKRRALRIARLLFAGLLVSALCGVVVAWLWPWPENLSTHLPSAPYWWDARLNMYIVWQAARNFAEGAHGLGIFHGDILFPHRDVLTYSENLLAFSMLAVPLRTRVSPELLHNVLLLFAMVVNVPAMVLYMRARGVSTAAALTSAVVFSMAPWRLCLLGRLQLEATIGLPLLALCLERAVARPTVGRWSLALAMWLLQLGTGVYYAVYQVLLFGPATVFLLAAHKRTFRKPLQTLFAMLLPGLVTAAIAAAVLAPYAKVARDMGFDRSGWMIPTSGHMRDLITASPWMEHWEKLQKEVDTWSGAEPIAFMGLAGPALAVVGLFFWVATRDRETWRWLRNKRFLRAAPAGPHFGPLTHLVWLGFCLVLYLGVGPDAPGGEKHSLYAMLLKYLPGFSGFRYPSRFIVPGTFMVAVLAGYGVEGLRLLFGRIARPIGLVVALAACALAVHEVWTKPVPLVELPVPGPIYTSLLGDVDAGALIELPYETQTEHLPKIDRNIAATIHGLPTANGYSGYDPPFALSLPEWTIGFPDERSHTLFKRIGINRVIARAVPMMRADQELAAGRVPWLRLIVRDGSAAVYAVTDVPKTRALQLMRQVAEVQRTEPPSGERLVPRETMGIVLPFGAAMRRALVDGDRLTRWTVQGEQQANVDWFTLQFPRPERVAALWLDPHNQPRELPRGVELWGREGEGEWCKLMSDSVHLPVGPWMAAPARAYDVLRFAPVRLTELRLRSIAASRSQLSLAEIYVERAP